MIDYAWDLTPGWFRRAFKVDVQCEPPLRTPVNTTPTLPSDPADAEDELALPRTLSLYLSSLTLDYGSASYGSGPTVSELPAAAARRGGQCD